MDLNQLMKLASNPQVQQLLKGLLTQFTSGGKSPLNGLMEQFNQAGMGNQAQSWVQNGPNQAMTGAQVQQVLGTSTLDQLAKQAGLPPEEAADDLAKMLPEIVNAASPQGKLPEMPNISAPQAKPGAKPMPSPPPPAGATPGASAPGNAGATTPAAGGEGQLNIDDLLNQLLGGLTKPKQ
jgi:uncharacterized protein YidB (DUF937 family)